VKAVVAAGLAVVGVKINPPGEILIVTNKQAEQISCESTGANEWDSIS